MVSGGLLTGLLAWWIGRAGGARAGRKSAERFRGELSDELRRQLDNRLGSRIRALEEERDSLTRAIEQVQIDLAAGLDEDA
jgi:predicted HTH domain antitoxin